MSKSRSTQSEAERLERVYRTYHNSSAVQGQWSADNAGNNAIAQERASVLGMLLANAGLLPLNNCRILDVGCSTGHLLASFTEWGAAPSNLYGVDLLEDRIEKATKRFPESHFYCANAERLDFADAMFDLVLLFTVFTSILDDQMARNVAAEVRRVLKVGGAVVWYDFRYNNPNNSNVRGMTSGAIRRLFPDFDYDLRTVTLLPPLARRLGPATQALYSPLVRLPLLRTHYLGLLIKR